MVSFSDLGPEAQHIPRKLWGLGGDHCLSRLLILQLGTQMLSDAVRQSLAQTLSLHTGGSTEGSERGCREMDAWGGDHDKRRKDRASSSKCVTQNSGSPSGS